MKKFLALILSLVMVFTLCACTNGGSAIAPGITVGLICLHDENSTYDANFINAFKSACDSKGVNYLIKTNIPEGQECYEAAAELADSGCSLVFADSFGHEDYIIQAAKEFTDVQFCHATGTKAHTENLSNFHNAFAAIYDGRYLDGVAAGLKLNELIADGAIGAEEAKLGYVGAYTYAEVISGYTAFFLGAKSVCPSVTMDVTFTGSWYDETAEKEAANKLIANDCVVLSAHADSMGVPTACQAAGVPFVFYNGSVLEACPDTFIISTRINWKPYFEYIIDCIGANTPIDIDWAKGLADNSVMMSDINGSVAAPETSEKLAELEEAIKAGELHVFDCSTFTVDGAHLSSYMADVDTDAAYTADTEVIIDGYFHESEFRSAPYFDLRIDGISLLDESY